MITFVSFYMDIGKQDLELVHSRVATVTIQEDPRVFLDMVFSACRLKHPDCRVVVLTDQFTSFANDVNYEIFRCHDLDSSRLMYSRSCAWLKFLESANSHVVFLDSDILIQESLLPVFEQEFDVGLTYRPPQRWPINLGIQFFHRDRLDQGVAYLRHYLRIFECNYMDNAIWGGEQDAVRDMTAGASFHRTDTHLWRSPDGYKLLLLPCARYNFSSEKESMSDYYPGIPVLHFKGRRKDDMPTYWNRYLNPSSSTLSR